MKQTFQRNQFAWIGKQIISLVSQTQKAKDYMSKLGLSDFMCELGLSDIFFFFFENQIVSVREYSLWLSASAKLR